MKLQELSKANLHFYAQDLVRSERKITARILEALAEIEKQKVFLDRGYESMFSYLVRELKYSEGAASRRIQAMRLYKSNNQVKGKIENGEMTLSQASMIQTVIRAESILHAQKIECTSELIAEVTSKTQKETRKILEKNFSSESLQSLEKQILIKEKEGTTVIVLKLSKDEYSLLTKVHDLKSTQHQNLKETILWMCKETLKKSKFAQAKDKVSSPEETGRIHLPLDVQRTVYQKANHQCEYKSPLTNQRCEQKKFLEIDHIQPLACGGTNELENLRALCREHNQLEARQKGIKPRIADSQSQPQHHAANAIRYH